jgi:hypothetical protein
MGRRTLIGFRASFVSMDVEKVLPFGQIETELSR